EVAFSECQSPFRRRFLRSHPSTGVTRLRQCYEPLRNPTAPALVVSRPAQRSLVLPPACSPGRLCDFLHQKLQQSPLPTPPIGTGWSEPVLGRVTPAVDHSIFAAHSIGRLARHLGEAKGLCELVTPVL